MKMCLACATEATTFATVCPNPRCGGTRFGENDTVGLYSNPLLGQEGSQRLIDAAKAKRAKEPG